MRTMSQFVSHHVLGVGGGVGPGLPPCADPDPPCTAPAPPCCGAAWMWAPSPVAPGTARMPCMLVQLAGHACTHNKSLMGLCVRGRHGKVATKSLRAEREAATCYDVSSEGGSIVFRQERYQGGCCGMRDGYCDLLWRPHLIRCCWGC